MRWLWLLLLVEACHPYRKVLLTSTFQEVCPGGNPNTAWLQFDRDGTFQFSYPKADQWQGQADEEWRLRRGDLILSWNDGYAISRYRLDDRTKAEVPGTSTKDACVSTVKLVWVGER